MGVSMGIPQAIYLMLVAAEITWACANHGKPQRDYNRWHSAFGQAIIFGLLWWGGFFVR